MLDISKGSVLQILKLSRKLHPFKLVFSQGILLIQMSKSTCQRNRVVPVLSQWPVSLMLVQPRKTSHVLNVKSFILIRGMGWWILLLSGFSIVRILWENLLMKEPEFFRNIQRALSVLISHILKVIVLQS